MTNPPINEIYGIPLGDIEKSFSSILDEGNFSLSPELLGGWSSLNLLGTAEDTPKYIVKFPPKLDRSDFSRLYKIHETLSEYNICAAPVAQGAISHKIELPYLIIEFERGKTYQRLEVVDAPHIEILQQTLTTLNGIDLRGIPEYSKGNDYGNQLLSSLKRAHKKWKNRIDQDVRDLLDEFLGVSGEAIVRLSDMEWNPVTIHGDLNERNIIFQMDKAILLDLEECCVADRHYDIVYFYTQYQDMNSEKVPQFARKNIPKSHWENLEILSLLSVISWCFKWLIDIELNIIESNLASSLSSPGLVRYIKNRLEVLTYSIKSAQRHV
jgi:aminoglycoside phosphotransferase (APT) family kinase protein